VIGGSVPVHRLVVAKTFPGTPFREGTSSLVQVLKIHSSFSPEAENFDSNMVLSQPREAVPVQSYTAWKFSCD
jgi:hypothetical protein